MIEIRSFGSFHVRQDGKYCATGLVSSCSKLIVFLLINHGVPQRREKLADLLYPDSEIEYALNSLSTNVWRIRRWIKANFSSNVLRLVASGRDLLFEGPDSSYWDISRFEHTFFQCCDENSEMLSAAQLTDMQKAICEYRGPFMEGESDDWILFERERLHCLFVRGLHKMMSSFAAERKFEDALDCGRLILKVDPLREYVHREMMRYYTESGQRALALRQFDLCSEILRDECNISPLPETIELMKSVRSGKLASHGNA